jgi:4-hydroxy-4-methyl-2-oxoglutarate aldolase
VGGVVVRPGDIVVGVRDGIAIVAHERLPEVVAASIAREQKEELMRSAIAEGVTTAELLKLTATLQRLDLL